MSDSRIYADRDCVETGSGCSLKGKVIVLKESAREAGFGRQLYYCTGGNGANAGFPAHRCRKPVPQAVFSVPFWRGIDR